MIKILTFLILLCLRVSFVIFVCVWIVQYLLLSVSIDLSNLSSAHDCGILCYSFAHMSHKNIDTFAFSISKFRMSYAKSIMLLIKNQSLMISMKMGSILKWGLLWQKFKLLTGIFLKNETELLIECVCLSEWYWSHYNYFCGT